VPANQDARGLNLYLTSVGAGRILAGKKKLVDSAPQDNVRAVGSGESQWAIKQGKKRRLPPGLLARSRPNKQGIANIPQARLIRLSRRSGRFTTGTVIFIEKPENDLLVLSRRYRDLELHWARPGRIEVTTNSAGQDSRRP